MSLRTFALYCVLVSGLLYSDTRAQTLWKVTNHGHYGLHGAYSYTAIGSCGNTVIVGGKRPFDTLPYYRIVMLRSTDAGLTWKESDIPIWAGYGAGQYDVWKIEMFDSLTAIARLDSNQDYYGFLIKTTDGGATWSKMNTPRYRIMKDFDFSDSLTGMITTYGGGLDSVQGTHIYTTTDGGIHWYTHRSPIIYPEFCKSYGNGMFRVWIYPYGPIFTTHDSWMTSDSGTAPYDTSKVSNDTNDYLLSHFTWGRGDTIIACGIHDHFTETSDRRNGAITRTTDGGKSWTDFPLADSFGIMNYMTELTYDTIYIPNGHPDHTMLRSTDAGASWQRDTILMDTDYTYPIAYGITMTSSGHPVAIFGGYIQGILVRGETPTLGVRPRDEEPSSFDIVASDGNSLVLTLSPTRYSTSVRLLDPLGRPIRLWQMPIASDEGRVTLKVADVPSGVYFLKIEGAETHEVKKVAIVH